MTRSYRSPRLDTGVTPELPEVDLPTESAYFDEERLVLEGLRLLVRVSESDDSPTRTEEAALRATAVLFDDLASACAELVGREHDEDAPKPTRKKAERKKP